ncbi:hypothetical protein MNNICLKF_01901 [Synechococcus sp. CBW1107]|nr:hypothetical protein MNNICLKF_01901 [Synechococcus sp. CBW1107]
MVPVSLTGYLWLKGLHPALPGWSCPLRALTGVPCPTCFLSRATSAALSGDLAGSLQLHAFGPLMAAALLWWSITALRSGALLPRPPKPSILSWGLATLLAYWALRLALSWQGIAAFPSATAP